MKAQRHKDKRAQRITSAAVTWRSTIIGEEDINKNTQGQGQNQNALKKITQPQNPNDFLLNLKDPQMDGQPAKPQKKFTPIDSYKPTGNLFYDDG